MPSNTKVVFLAVFTFAAISLCSCGKGINLRRRAQSDTTELTPLQRDSLKFDREHHYSQNYNFVVRKPSLVLLRQLPEEALIGMPVDSVVLSKGDHIVVADIRVIPHDPKDCIWVQVARDQQTFGWARESHLLPSVVPDDSISKFISIFSDVHYVIFFIVIILIAAAYVVRVSFRRNAHIVHFNDIPSFYPTLLTLIVATSASFYATIQNFSPDTWREFYYHPTLNPFVAEPVLSVFLVSVWAMLIVGIASVDVARQRLPLDDSVLYVFGLAAVCAADYIIFSVTTLWYVGYVLLAGYIFFAIRRYLRSFCARYECGNCGKPIYHKGRCEACGAMNE